MKRKQANMSGLKTSGSVLLQALTSRLYTSGQGVLISDTRSAQHTYTLSHHPYFRGFHKTDMHLGNQTRICLQLAFCSILSCCRTRAKYLCLQVYTRSSRRPGLGRIVRSSREKAAAPTSKLLSNVCSLRRALVQS